MTGMTDLELYASFLTRPLNIMANLSLESGRLTSSTGNTVVFHRAAHQTLSQVNGSAAIPAVRFAGERILRAL